MKFNQTDMLQKEENEKEIYMNWWEYLLISKVGDLSRGLPCRLGL